MDPIFQFIAIGLWTFGCLIFGAVLGYLLRYTMESRDSKPVCYGSKAGQCSGKGGKPASRSASQAPRPATPRPLAGETTDDDLNSNMGFEVMSDDAAPVPETTVPPPPTPDPREIRHRRIMGGYTDRGPNVPMYFTDTDGTRIHTKSDCKGLRPASEGGRRVKPLTVKSTCSWCCGGVVVIP